MIVYCSVCRLRLIPGHGDRWIATEFELGVDRPCLPWDHRPVTTVMAASAIAEVWRSLC